jgi:hypothetical protein
LACLHQYRYLGCRIGLHINSYLLFCDGHQFASIAFFFFALEHV